MSASAVEEAVGLEYPDADGVAPVAVQTRPDDDVHAGAADARLGVAVERAHDRAPVGFAEFFVQVDANERWLKRETNPVRLASFDDRECPLERRPRLRLRGARVSGEVGR